MNPRRVVLIVVTFFLILACRPPFGEDPRPIEAMVPTVTDTDLPVAPTPEIPMQTPEAETPGQPDPLEIIDAENWSRLQLLKSFPAEIPLQNSAVAISPDGRTMAVGSSNGAQIHFFELPAGQLSQTISIDIPDVGDYFHLVGIEYLPDGTLIANSTGPYQIYHLDTSGNVLAMWDGGSFALSADKSLLAHNADGAVALVDIANNIPRLSLEDTDAMSFAFAPDASKIAVEGVGVDSLHTAIWDIPSQTLLTTLDEAANPRFSPDGRFLAVTQYETDASPLKIFNPDGSVEVVTLNVGEGNGLSNKPALWSVDGSIVVAQVAQGQAVAWETSNWSLLETPILQGEIDSFSPDGRILVTRAADGAIFLWGVFS